MSLPSLLPLSLLFSFNRCNELYSSMGSDANCSSKFISASVSARIGFFSSTEKVIGPPEESFNFGSMTSILLILKFGFVVGGLIILIPRLVLWLYQLLMRF